jgi:hypothetical protein
MSKLPMTILLALFGMTLSAPLLSAEEDQPTPPPALKPKELIERYDANEDGRLSSREKKNAAKKEALRRFDVNGDGKLNRDELKRRKTVLDKEAQLKKRLDDAFKRYDRDRDELIDVEEELGGGMGRMLGRADKNDDGMIDRDELEDFYGEVDNWRKGRRGRGKDSGKKGPGRKKGDDDDDDDEKDGEDDDGDESP